METAQDRGEHGVVQADGALLYWSPPVRVFSSDSLLAYRVYRTPAGEPFPYEPLAELDSLRIATSYADTALAPGTYHYVVTSVYQSGESGPSNEIEVMIEESPSGVAMRAEESAALRPAPNPFAGETIIRFSSRGAAPPRLEVYDTTGARVRSLLVARSLLPAGEAAAVWDGRDDQDRPLPNGIYFLRLEEGGRTVRRSVALLR